MDKYLIPLKDYERIHKTIYSILINEDAQTHHSCIYYSLFGAYILNEHYNIDPKVHAGIAGYRLVSGDQGTLLFAEINGSYLSCSDNGFHCWIEAEGWLIDFMAPSFPAMMKEAGNNNTFKPFMFQKEINLASETPDEMSDIEDFFISSYPEFMNDIFNNFISKPLNTDLIEICSQWYKKPPKKMVKNLPISDGKGNISTISLVGKSMTSVL
jgi:hypothetical protein